MNAFTACMPVRNRTCGIYRCLITGVSAATLLAAILITPVSYAAKTDSGSPWVATWGTAMMAVSRGGAKDVSNKTLREIIHTSVGGGRVRIWLSNRFGQRPLHVGTAHIAISANGTAGYLPDGKQDLSADGSAIQAGTDRTLTFNGQGSIVIPPGATAVSDPVALHVPAFSELAISMYLPDPTLVMTEHSYADQISYMATGDVTGTTDLAGTDSRVQSWYFLTGADVEVPGSSAVVAIGDSITDGVQSTPNANERWPDDLAKRLAADEGTRKAGVVGVVNVGIGGNRVLMDGIGPNAISRINRDIVARSNAKYVIILEGINDIAVGVGRPYGDLAERLETGLAQIATQAHQQGMKVIGATVLPYLGCQCYSQAGDEVRSAVNQWIRTSPIFDGVADFDKVVRDPEKFTRIAPQYDSGDHVHPNDAGYKAMADSIDLGLLAPSR